MDKTDSRILVYHTHYFKLLRLLDFRKVKYFPVVGFRLVGLQIVY